MEAIKRRSAIHNRILAVLAVTGALFLTLAGVMLATELFVCTTI